jgi:hypothetical protein
MYNSDRPNNDELPTTKQLIRSTFIALLAAVAILITIVLPSEYGIDPTGIGKGLGLTEMGEIKIQLEQEAEKDHSLIKSNQQPTYAVASFFEQIFSTLIISPAAAQTTSSTWTDEIKLELTPGQGAEIKLVMKEGGKAEYSWVSENGKANYDLHADGSGKSKSYKKGRGVPGDDGILEAAFNGSHGWFWRNRDKQTITIILRVRGEYTDIKKYL